MTVSHQYIIGDLQGCFSAYQRLLEHINFDPTSDMLYFAGDLVARGEDSLSTLRHVKQLAEQGCAQTVLGNHDITLIASWRKIMNTKPKDKTEAILQADDCDELMNWLRHQPLLLLPDEHSVITHAGIPPHWSIDQAVLYAKEVETVLQADLHVLDAVLPHFYQKNADNWQSDLDGNARLRAITNYFTRMRLCDLSGHLDLTYKDGIDGDMPVGFKPWFYWSAQRARQHRIFFGHWAALQADIDTESVRATDGGCVWGGQLIAHRLNDNKTFTVNAE